MRLILLYCFLVCTLGLCAQENGIKKSSETVVIRGENFYMHTVEKGQTLYSIAKAYQVTPDLIRQLNDKTDDTLSLMDVLKIPVVEEEAFVTMDKTYFYYKAKKGETVYSIARKYDIKPKKLLKENKQYNKLALRIGDVVRLPLKELDRSVILQLQKESQQTPDAPPAGTEEIHDMVVRPDLPSLDISTFFPAGQRVKVALLLPFFTEENQAANAFLTDTVQMKDVRNKKAALLNKAEQFVFFYEGVLLALDSLKNRGYNLEMHVFDTYRDNARIYEIAHALDSIVPDVVIGPAYTTELKTLADTLVNKNIPLVYPFSSRIEELCKHPNVIQVTPTPATLFDKMSEWITRQSKDANIISISMPHGDSADKEVKEKLFAGARYIMPDSNFYHWEPLIDHKVELEPKLIAGLENIIVFPATKETDVSKVLSVLASLSSKYKITLVGMPEWVNFSTLEYEMYYKANVKIFTYSYIDNYTTEAKGFTDAYRKYFHTEPHTLSNKAYDIALHFITLAARYGNNLLEHLTAQSEKDGLFSRFKFYRPCPDAGGLENEAFYIVNFGKNYKVNVEPYTAVVVEE